MKFGEFLEVNEELNEATYRNIKQVLSFLDMARKGQVSAQQVKNYGEASYVYLQDAIKSQKIK